MWTELDNSKVHIAAITRAYVVYVVAFLNTTLFQKITFYIRQKFTVHLYIPGVSGTG